MHACERIKLRRRSLGASSVLLVSKIEASPWQLIMQT